MINWYKHYNKKRKKLSEGILLSDSFLAEDILLQEKGKSFTIFFYR